VKLRQIGVAGFGTMGSEIALLASMAGYEVFAYDVVAGVVEDKLKRLSKLIRMLRKEASDDERAEVIERISVQKDLDGFAGCDLVVEAVLEDFEVKSRFFSELNGICGQEAIFATNTSSIGITRLAAVSGRPERFIGLHFFNPPSQMTLVEVVPGLQTTDEVRDASVEFIKKLGKKPLVFKETPGVVVNRVLMAMAVEAMALYEEGIGEPAEIDEALRRGAGWPLGPFKLMDLVGLDVFLQACEMLYREHGNSKFRPPFVLKQLVQAGRLGRKTRAGFYDY